MRHEAKGTKNTTYALSTARRAYDVISLAGNRTQQEKATLHASSVRRQGAVTKFYCEPSIIYANDVLQTMCCSLRGVAPKVKLY